MKTVERIYWGYVWISPLLFYFIGVKETIGIFAGLNFLYGIAFLTLKK